MKAFVPMTEVSKSAYRDLSGRWIICRCPVNITITWSATSFSHPVAPFSCAVDVIPDADRLIEVNLLSPFVDSCIHSTINEWKSWNKSKNAYKVIRVLHLTSHPASFPSKKISSNCTNNARTSGVGSSNSHCGSTNDSNWLISLPFNIGFRVTTVRKVRPRHCGLLSRLFLTSQVENITKQFPIRYFRFCI